MDGIAMQIDQSISTGTRRGWPTRFKWPEDVDGLDFPWWVELRDTSQSVRNYPLSVAGFVQLGGLNSSSAATKNRIHPGSCQDVADDVVPTAQVKLSVPRSADVLGNDAKRALVSDRRESVPASSATDGVAAGVVTRADNEDSSPEVTATSNTKPSPTAVERDPFQRLQELSQRVKAGDDSAMAEIRQILDGNHALWRELGDIQTTTEATLIEFVEGTAASKESVRRSVAAMKQSLLGAKPTPLEKMAVGRVVACWLFANFVDRWCGWSIKQGGRASDLAKLLEASEKRHAIALKSFKLVQAIRSPAV